MQRNWTPRKFAPLCTPWTRVTFPRSVSIVSGIHIPLDNKKMSRSWALSHSWTDQSEDRIPIYGTATSHIATHWMQRVEQNNPGSDWFRVKLTSQSDIFVRHCVLGAVRLAPEATSDELTGFQHNAVTPIGMKTAIPVSTFLCALSRLGRHSPNRCRPPLLLMSSRYPYPIVFPDRKS